VNPPASDIPEDAIVALKNGRKIEAIKLTRAETGMHLKESKEAVERYIDSVPELKEKFKTGRGIPLFLLVLVLVAVGIYVSGLFS